jgi:hypothetical protein
MKAPWFSGLPMNPIVITLDPEDCSWLEQQAKSKNTSVDSIIRQAVKLMRQELVTPNPAFEELLELSRGTWHQGDGLAYQQTLREEWR